MTDEIENTELTDTEIMILLDLVYERKKVCIDRIQFDADNKYELITLDDIEAKLRFML